MNEDLYDLFGETDLYLDGTKVGKVTEQKIKLKDDPLSDDEHAEMDKLMKELQQKVFSATGVPASVFGSPSAVQTARELQEKQRQTQRASNPFTFNLGGSHQDLVEAMLGSYKQASHPPLRKPEEYALRIENLIEEFPTNILMEMRDAILSRHPEIEIHDFKEFNNYFKSTGCVVRKVSSLSRDLSHLLVIDAQGNEIKVADPKAEFKLSNGNYLVVKY
jgi:hypothetical protein